MGELTPAREELGGPRRGLVMLWQGGGEPSSSETGGGKGMLKEWGNLQSTPRQ